MQNLSLPFKCRSQDGTVNVTLQPNNDHDHAFGLDLIFPQIPPSRYARHFIGFPVMSASIAYSVPANPYLGYRSLFGWIQSVKETKKSEPGRDWEMDIFPFAKDLKNPFAYMGFNPTAFDAPARLLDEHGKNEGLIWRAQSYLCVLEDVGLSKVVQVVPGAAFTWGFDIEVEESSPLERRIAIAKAEAIDVETEWRERLELLRESYPEWTFRDFGGV